VHNQGTKGELRMKISRRVLLAVAAAGFAAVAAATAAHSGGSGFKTTQPTMLTPVQREAQRQDAEIARAHAVKLGA